MLNSSGMQLNVFGWYGPTFQRSELLPSSSFCVLNMEAAHYSETSLRSIELHSPESQKPSIFIFTFSPTKTLYASVVRPRSTCKL
jgi:hypothetical protein